MNLYVRIMTVAWGTAFIFGWFGPLLIFNEEIFDVICGIGLMGSVFPLTYFLLFRNGHL